MLIDRVLPKISKRSSGDMIETQITLLTTGLDVYSFFSKKNVTLKEK